MSSEISDGEFGTLYPMGTLASVAVIVWSGRLVDRLRLKDMAALVVSGLALMCALMRAAWTPAVLVVTIFGLRQFDQRLASHTAITSITRRFDRERGGWCRWPRWGNIAGEGVLSVVTVARLAIFVWRDLWLFSAGLLAVSIRL